MSDLEDAIRKRAYQIWEAEGRPQGQDQAHWYRAAGEIPKPDEAAETGIAGGPPPPTEEPSDLPPKEGP